jgi:isorenieratene synthase
MIARSPFDRRAERRLWTFGRALPAHAPLDRRPDHEQASAAWIARALWHATALPGGGWYAVDACAAIGARPRAYLVRGRAFVVWRDADGIVAAPEACPHLGAPLAQARVCAGKLICPWHGLALGREGHGGWKPVRVHDDGVLFWVRLDDERDPVATPFLPTRPAGALTTVVRVEAACESRDVLANRLDPWHGTHYHPHSFARLQVIERDERAITVRVAYRLLGRLAIEVDARFHCPDPRTIAMTIVRGEGEGSVVETHATPLAAGRTAIVEATFASSQRAGFRAARRLAPLLRPAIAWAARRLWIEDAAYAERLYSLRARPGRHRENAAAMDPGASAEVDQGRALTLVERR